MTDKLTAVADFAQTTMAGDQSGHGYDHVERVVNLTRQLLAENPANGEIALTAAYLHDCFDEKLTSDPDAARARVTEQLTDIGYQPAAITAILAIIDHMSFAANLEHHQQLSPEGQLVQDADRLDALGAIGIARTFAYGAVHGYAMYDPQVRPRTNLTKANYRQPETTINHFYEKLFKLPEQMNTVTARRLGNERKQYMQEFVAEFKAEWNEL
ncbi:HD domain-containing protein [Fructilactobacillus myrtifloralis]|uniref:HD domain-containing protein n=1 Tax=Fructilactobacillus myrtifloralis TaxID=2940301 RepID=A0ABY5BLH2_9LACO|nr:HD domain-containing protein [Fructilactobacillus myrtifloralis]USS84523.1 HD domain-containing protein [Fructilactobacillus myrtifloralis]